MAFNNKKSKVEFNGNGSATRFSTFPVVVFGETELQVTVVDSSGNETPVSLGTGPNDFSVNTTFEPNIPTVAEVVYPADEVTPLPSGSRIIIKRVISLTQNVLSLENQGGYLPEIQETGFDRAMMGLIQLEEEIERSIKVSIGSTADTDELLQDVQDIADNLSDVNTVATDITNVNTVGTNIADVTAVAADEADIGTVATDITNVNTVATDITNVNTVATDITNVNTVASNITGVNSFAERYRVDSSDPTTSLDAGDLVYNSTDQVVKYYDGSTWNNITSPSTLLSQANEYTKTQNFDATTLTDAANISWDLENNQVASVTLGGNRTLDNPTNQVDGATYILTVKQDGTGGRTLSFGTAYQFPGGDAPSLTGDANAVDVLTFVSDGTNMRAVLQGDFS